MLADGEAQAAVQYARDLLDPRQQRMPAEIEPAYGTAVDEADRASLDEAGPLLSRAARDGEALGYTSA